MFAEYVAARFFTETEMSVGLRMFDEDMSRSPEDRDYRHLSALDPREEVEGFTCCAPIDVTDWSWILYWIVVRKDRQRSGVGTRMLKSVEAEARLCGGMWLYLDTSSSDRYSPTRAFYERTGFEIAARLSDYYRRGDDNIIYRKLLGSDSAQLASSR